MTQSFNLAVFANKLNTSGQLDASTGLVNTTPVANGGTGLATLTAKNLMVGNGTSAVAFIAPGSSGNTLVSNGTDWQSIAAPYAGGKGQVFTSSGTFTIPSGVSALKVTVIGGGGAGGGATYAGSNVCGTGGGGGGAAIQYLTGLTPGATLTVTVGAGGTATTNVGGTGGSSSVASGTQSISTISATGGVGGASVSSSSGLGGVGGAGSGGSVNISGGFGGNVYDQQLSGFGGSTILSGNAASILNNGTNQVGNSGASYGGGGSGASVGAASRNGGTGASGVVIFEW